MSKIRILYVEDDEALAFITKEEMLQENYEIVHCDNGKTAIDTFDNEHFDLAILDIMLPKVDGFEIAKHIRSKNDEMPILFLSAKSLEEDRLKGFEIGADDYLTKPFSMDELLFKIKIFLKRRNIENSASQSNYTFCGYEFSPNDLTLKNDKVKFDITAKEADLLALLLDNANTTVKRSDILIKLWGKDDYFLGRSLDVFISRLRKYFAHSDEVQIETVRRVGFKLCK